MAALNLPETRQLSLAQALDLADRENPDLAGRRARIDQADAAARQAQSAVLPILKASASYTLNNEDARIGVPGGGEFVLQPRDSLSASTSLQVPLFAQNAYSDIARARELGRAERSGYEADRQLLRGAVVRACWLLESARSIVRVAEQGVASAAKHRDSTRHAADAGTATPLAVLQAESDLMQRRDADGSVRRGGPGRARSRGAARECKTREGGGAAHRAGCRRPGAGSPAGG